MTENDFIFCINRNNPRDHLYGYAWNKIMELGVFHNTSNFKFISYLSGNSDNRFHNKK